MTFSLRFLAAGIIVMGVHLLAAAPQLLEQIPIESPDKTYTANVEWDDAGFIGRIRMLIYTRGETPSKIIELPQMKPAPANLTWISEDWVACESFVAEQGAAFFYTDVPRSRGYLLEILAPEKDGDWLITYTTNDSISSDSIHTISRGRSSLFPILLRDLPAEGLSYFTPDFAYLLSDGVDAYVQWRKKEKFTNLDFLTPVAEDPDVGRLAVMAFDNTAELVYFPQRTTTTREMLALTRRQKLPDNLQAIIKGIDPPELGVEWVGKNGEFSITGTNLNAETTVTELVRGRFEDVSDSIYTGPGIADLLKESRQPQKSPEKAEEKKSDSSKSKSSKSSSNSSSKKSSSKSKSPSRSK